MTKQPEPAPAIWDTTNAIVETDASEPALSIDEAYALAEAARVQMEAR